MDALKPRTIHALKHIICVSEDLLNVKITQNLEKEESDEPEYWAPSVYLVPGAWSWGAESDLKPGLKVTLDLLAAINNFLETFKE